MARLRRAGKDIANPTALLQSAILMLRHIGEDDAADKTQSALEKVYSEGKTLARGRIERCSGCGDQGTG